MAPSIDFWNLSRNWLFCRSAYHNDCGVPRMWHHGGSYFFSLANCFILGCQHPGGVAAMFKQCSRSLLVALTAQLMIFLWLPVRAEAGQCVSGGFCPDGYFCLEGGRCAKEAPAGTCAGGWRRLTTGGCVPPSATICPGGARACAPGSTCGPTGCQFTGTAFRYSGGGICKAPSVAVGTGCALPSEIRRCESGGTCMANAQCGEQRRCIMTVEPIIRQTSAPGGGSSSAKGQNDKRPGQVDASKCPKLVVRERKTLKSPYTSSLSNTCNFPIKVLVNTCDISGCKDELFTLPEMGRPFTSPQSFGQPPRITRVVSP